MNNYRRNIKLNNMSLTNHKICVANSQIYLYNHFSILNIKCALKKKHILVFPMSLVGFVAFHFHLLNDQFPVIENNNSLTDNLFFLVTKCSCNLKCNAILYLSHPEVCSVPFTE